MTKRFYFTPTLLLLSKFFYLISVNCFTVLIDGLFCQLCALTSLSLGVTALAYGLFRKREQAICFSLVLTLLFLSYRVSYELLHSLFQGANALTLNVIYGVLVCALLAVIIRFSESKVVKGGVGFVTNIIYFLFFISFSSVCLFCLKVKDIEKPKLKELREFSESQQLSSHPDIYYIILDGYCRQDVLKESYQYDNTAFLDQLQNRGFVVSQQATCSYPFSYISLSSTLNMQYIERANQMDNNYYKFIQDNQVARCLKNCGYTYATVNTGWSGTYKSKIADIQYDLPYSNGFLSAFLEGSVLSPWMPNHADNVKHALESSNEAVTIKSPKFVFSHFLVPHAPYSF